MIELDACWVRVSQADWESRCVSVLGAWWFRKGQWQNAGWMPIRSTVHLIAKVLYGKQTFTNPTDYNLFRWTLYHGDSTGWLVRRRSDSEMHFDVVHRKNIKNQAAEALSLLETEQIDMTLLADDTPERVVRTSNWTTLILVYGTAARLNSAVCVDSATSSLESCRTL